MADLINERVNAAQAELEKRAERLKSIVAASQNKKKSEGFAQGIELVSSMIEGQTKLIDSVVFDSPRTRLEQQRNLMLMTGNMNQTVQEGMKSTTDAIDGMLDALEQMSR